MLAEFEVFSSAAFFKFNHVKGCLFVNHVLTQLVNYVVLDTLPAARV